MDSKAYKRRSNISKDDNYEEEKGNSNIQGDSMMGKISFLAQISDVCDTKKDDEDGEDEKKIIKRGLVCLRIITGAVLISLALITSGVVVAITDASQQMAFKLTFNDASSKMREGIELSLNNSVGCAWTLSTIYTGHFEGYDLWPNVTLQNFVSQAESLLYISKARAIGFSPLLNNQTNRLQWEAYAASMGQGQQVTRQNNNSDREWSVQDGIYELKDNTEVYDTGYTPDSKFPYILTPIWQVSDSINQDTLMYNMHSEDIRMRAIDDMLTYKIFTLSAILTSNIPDDPTYNNPSSMLYVPVLNYSKIAAIVFLRFSWEVMFSHILPNNINGIICILKDSTNSIHTFFIDGPTATYQGEGDLHSSTYDSLMQQFNISIANVSQSFEMEGAQVVTYTIEMYPSDAFKDKYSTNIPLHVGLGVLILFIITFPLFILYDCLLHYHLKTLAESATKSDQIIKSLYPNVVRKRLFQMNDEQQQQEELQQNNRQADRFLSIDVTNNLKPVASKIKEFLRLGDDNSNRKSSKPSLIGQPIAYEYPSVTIMFADIAGFTSWSSAHTPQQVFKLLESIFGQFDRVAKKLGVFKIETIGDCYVAVCGLPDPRDDHAVVMSQFALECQRKFKQVATSLEDIGADILRLRSGLHSGSITAGILRGEKSRFQLFGDTMNTASRMESTGEPTKVQISEQTAELLIKAGKNSWFIPRETKITAKGKGVLQTYWLVPNIHIKDLLKGSTEGPC